LAHHAIQPVPIRTRQLWALAATLVLLALAASWVGIRNSFTYDDVFIVQNNTVLQDITNWWKVFGQPYWPVAWGSDGYRPMTILAFLLQWLAAGGKAWVFHATNIALYAGTTVAVFFLARACLPLAAAWVAAALFAVHPVHVEAVANIVGQSELWVAAFMLPAIIIYVRSRNADELSPWRMAAILALYAAACLSKEHGIVLPAVLLAAELTIVVDKRPIRERFARLRPFVLSLTAVGLAYLLVHFRISSGQTTGFHEYIAFSSSQVGTTGRWWTMFGLAPQWLRLLLWPQRLTAEYGPPEYPVVGDFEPYQIAGFLILAGLVSLMVAARRRAPAASFGIAFSLIALLPTSNFLVPTGILLAERTMFLPSVGAMIAVGSMVPWIYARARTASLQLASAGVLAALLALGGWRSHNRTQVWKDNDTLFAQSVIDGPFVYRTHFMLGAWQFNKKQKVAGERSYRVAMTLYDQDPFVYFSLGQEYLMAGKYSAAAPYFRRTIEVDPAIVEARARLAVCLVELGRFEEARAEALRALRDGSYSLVSMQYVLMKAAGKQWRPRKRRVSQSDTAKAEAASGKVPSDSQNTAPQTDSTAGRKM
jgi:hypothetical protein